MIFPGYQAPGILASSGGSRNGQEYAVNIVHLTASTFFGGPERQMLGLASALPDDSSAFISFAEGGRCRSFLARVRRDGFEAIKLENDTPHLRAAARELASNLERLKADVLLCHGYKANILGRIAARRRAIPGVAVSRGWTGESLRVRAYETLDRLHLRWMDRVVAVSEAQAAEVAAAASGPRTRGSFTMPSTPSASPTPTLPTMPSCDGSFARRPLASSALPAGSVPRRASKFSSTRPLWFTAAIRPSASSSSARDHAGNAVAQRAARADLTELSFWPAFGPISINSCRSSTCLRCRRTPKGCRTSSWSHSPPESRWWRRRRGARRRSSKMAPAAISFRRATRRHWRTASSTPFRARIVCATWDCMAVNALSTVSHSPLRREPIGDCSGNSAHRHRPPLTREAAVSEETDSELLRAEEK